LNGRGFPQSYGNFIGFDSSKCWITIYKWSLFVGKIIKLEDEMMDFHRFRAASRELINVESLDEQPSDWWFGTCFLFSHILGIITSQLTNIFQRG